MTRIKEVMHLWLLIACTLAAEHQVSKPLRITDTTSNLKSTTQSRMLKKVILIIRESEGLHANPLIRSSKSRLRQPIIRFQQYSRYSNLFHLDRFVPLLSKLSISSYRVRRRGSRSELNGRKIRFMVMRMQIRMLIRHSTRMTVMKTLMLLQMDLEAVVMSQVSRWLVDFLATFGETVELIIMMLCKID